MWITLSTKGGATLNFRTNSLTIQKGKLHIGHLQLDKNNAQFNQDDIIDLQVIEEQIMTDSSITIYTKKDKKK